MLTNITQVATYVAQSARLCHKGANWQITLQILANYRHFSLKAVFPDQTLIGSNLG